MTKEEIVDRLVDLYTDSQIPVTAAGGIFAFTYGEHVVDVYKRLFPCFGKKLLPDAA